MKPRTPANTLRALDPDWRTIVNGIERAQRNLAEIQPGYPATTPGNGSPGGGSGGGRNSITERLAIDPQPDKAAADYAALARCVTLIRNEIDRLYPIVTQYNYATGGEDTAGVNERHAMPRDVNAYAEAGCTSCARPEVRQWSTVHKNGLCRWCYDLQRAEGFAPTQRLLEMHHDGIRMSASIVAKELRPLRDEAKRIAATKQSKRKKGKAAA